MPVVVEKTRETWHCGIAGCKDCATSPIATAVKYGKIQVSPDKIITPDPLGALVTWPEMTGIASITEWPKLAPLPPLVYVKWPEIDSLGAMTSWPEIPPLPPLGALVTYEGLAQLGALETFAPLELPNWKKYKNGQQGAGHAGNMGSRIQHLPPEWGWPTTYATREYGDDYQDWWGHKFNDYDPVEAAADFYLLGAIADRLWVAQPNMRWTGNKMLDVIIEEGRMKYERHVDLWAPMLADYMDMVIGGELRHHRAVGAQVIAGRDSRPHAWVAWRFLRREVGTDALIHGAELFRDIGRGGFGGDKWAVGCEVLHAYLTRKIPAAVFIDRVWDLEHNGGCFLNKIPWKIGMRGGAASKTLTKYQYTLTVTRTFHYVDGRASKSDEQSVNFSMKDKLDRQVRAWKRKSKQCDQYLADGMNGVEYTDFRVSRSRTTTQRGYNIGTIKAEIGPAHANDEWPTLIFFGTPDAVKIFRDYRAELHKDRVSMMGARGALPRFERYSYDHYARRGINQ